MTRFTYWPRTLMPLIGMLLTLLCNGIRFLCLRPSPALSAENLFLRKHLALYQERYVTPRRITHTTRMALIWLTRWFDWRQALALVRPATLIRWHRQGFRLFWRWKATCGSSKPRCGVPRLVPSANGSWARSGVNTCEGGVTIAPSLSRPQEHKSDRVVDLGEGFAGDDQLNSDAAQMNRMASASRACRCPIAIGKMPWRKQASIACWQCSGKSTDVLLIIAVLRLGSGIRSPRSVVVAQGALLGALLSISA